MNVTDTEIPRARVTVAAHSDRAWDSGVRSPYGYGVPRWFLWLTDLAIPTVAFALARLVAPWFQQMVALGGPLHVPAFASLSIDVGPGGLNALGDVLWILPVATCAYVVFMEALGGYQPILHQSWLRLACSNVGASVMSLSVVSLILLTLKLDQISRAFVFSMALFAALLGLTGRLALRHYKGARLASGHYARNVLAIGAPTAVAALTRRHFSGAASANFYRLCGYLSVPETLETACLDRTRAAGELEHARLGSVSGLGDLLVNRPIHEVVAIDADGSQAWLPGVIERCEYFRVTLRIVPEVLLLSRPPTLRDERDHRLNVPAVIIRPSDFDSDAVFVKRVMDVALSVLLLVLLSPVFLVIALVIKIGTPHLPVFYPWRVVGYNGRAFTGYKFTTMEADADERKGALMHLNEMSGPVFKIADDPRVTWAGKFLRKFSLNELPQLWSVLKGDMSLVGPRPAYPNELARYELWQKRKLCVQPGITCLWQIRGRNKIASFDDWVRMDFEYIDNWSLWLDCTILARTVWAVVRGSGS